MGNLRKRVAALGLTVLVLSGPLTLLHLTAKASARSFDWAKVMSGSCANCTKRGPEIGVFSDIKLPRRAITESFTGEFATAVQLCVIDLDSGLIGCHVRKASFGPTPKEPVQESDETSQLAPVLLDAIRAEVARLWASGRHVGDFREFNLMPGCEEDRAIVLGDKQLHFGEMGFRPDVIAGVHMRELVRQAVAAVG